MKDIDPSRHIYDYEFNHLFLSFCSLVTLLHTKKLNLANVFLLLLQNRDLLDLYKEYCDFKSDFAAIKSFLSFDSSLHKSKYIMKYLNGQKNKKNL